MGLYTPNIEFAKVQAFLVLPDFPVYNLRYLTIGLFFITI